MPYRDSVESRITFNTTGITAPVFSDAIFTTAHMYFPERVRAYSSWTAVKEDTTVPTGSNLYEGLRLAFQQQPAPSRVYAGRRKASKVTLEASPVADFTKYGLTVNTIKDDDQTKSQYTIEITSGATATAVSIMTALEAAINSGAHPEFTATLVTDVIDLVPTAGYTLWFDVVKNLAQVATTTETAADLLTALRDEEDDWYFFACEDHTEAFALAMAAEIEATNSDDQPKMYALGSQDPNTIVALAVPAVDLAGKLKEFGYARTFVTWYHDADTKFPEMGIVGANGVYQPGSTTWKFVQVSGLTESRDPVTGKPLSQTKQGYIDDRNANWFGIEKKITFFREGKLASGEWIDVIHFADWLNSEIERDVMTALVNRKGSKYANNQYGKAEIASIIETVLQRGVTVGGLTGYTGPTYPPESQVSFNDRTTRIFKDVKWTGFLAGAIHTVVIDGELTYASAELV